LGGKVNTIKKYTEALIDSSEKNGLEVNTEETKHVLIYRHQNAGRRNKMRITNREFENVAKFRYLGRTLTNQNLTNQEIKKRFNFGNASYRSLQNLLSSSLLSKYLNIKIFRTVILPVVLYGCDIWSLILME
jgi:hypothetical protein